jgi:hypothetical protein
MNLSRDNLNNLFINEFGFAIETPKKNIIVSKIIV